MYYVLSLIPAAGAAANAYQYASDHNPLSLAVAVFCGLAAICFAATSNRFGQ